MQWQWTYIEAQLCIMPQEWVLNSSSQWKQELLNWFHDLHGI